MIYPCFFCQKPFEKGSQSCPDLIDFTKYPARDETFKVFVKNRKLVARKSTLINVPKELIIPPILHCKIKIGNVLFEKFQDNEKDSKFFQEIVQRWNLNVDRKAEDIVYSKFHGNDVKRLCRSLPDFATIPLSDHSKQILAVLRDFDKWSKAVSSTKVNISSEEAAVIACKEFHSSSRDCCLTATLATGLETVGGFGTSPLIHMIVMHLGFFVHKNKFIGAGSEEELESFHSKLSNEMTRHKLSGENRLENALKWMCIDVLLSDSGLIL